MSEVFRFNGAANVRTIGLYSDCRGQGHDWGALDFADARQDRVQVIVRESANASGYSVVVDRKAIELAIRKVERAAARKPLYCGVYESLSGSYVDVETAGVDGAEGVLEIWRNLHPAIPSETRLSFLIRRNVNAEGRQVTIEREEAEDALRIVKALAR